MASALKLLVVEDDPGIGDIVQRVANEAGYMTFWTSGAKVEWVYKQFQPDVVVLDIIMPEMDGIEVLQFFKNQYKPLQVVILSGSPHSYRNMVSSLGTAAGFTIAANIAKPFRVAELRMVLERIRDLIDGDTLQLDKSSEI